MELIFKESILSIPIEIARRACMCVPEHTHIHIHMHTHHHHC